MLALKIFKGTQPGLLYALASLGQCLARVKNVRGQRPLGAEI